MSVRLMSIVWANFERGGSEKLVLLALADWANDDGGSLHPSIGAIARKSCLQECRARRIVHGFIAEGLLEVVGNEGGGKPGMTRQYRLNVARLLATPVPKDTPVREDTPVLRARDGCTPVPERAVLQESQSIIEPPENRQRPARSAGCPYEKLVKLYHETLPGNPRCHVISDTRKRHMAARWDLWRGKGKYAGTEDGLTWWRKFFAYVGESAFLTGRAAPRPGREPFFADVDFLFGAEKHVQIIEGKYHESATATRAEAVTP